MARKKRVIRSTAKLTTLDDFLGEEGKRDEFEAIAVKEVSDAAAAKPAAS